MFVLFFYLFFFLKGGVGAGVACMSVISLMCSVWVENKLKSKLSFISPGRD